MRRSGLPLSDPGRPQRVGAPLASDCAVTRHLAEFLRGRPPVDAILFNGGALRPKLLRERICQQVGKWQGGSPLLELETADLELGVARGAALFGKSIHRKTERIEAGAARAVFLEVLPEQSPELANTARPSLICVLPRGALSEQRFEVTGVPLEMQTNRLARFQAFSSPRHDGCKAGDIIEFNEESFRPLPPLETVIRLESGAGRTSDTIPIKLVASTNDLDLLHVSCVSADPRVEQSWPLEFNLRTRKHDQQPPRPTAASRPVKPNIGPAPLAAAKLQTERFFARSVNQRDPITAARVLKKLEQVLGMPRGAWNAGLVRSLWAALETCMARRKLSADHEESWLILAGFLLRPGFGAPADDLRIDSLWRLREQGLCFSGKRTKTQEYILWRRVAGGLSQQRQEQIIAAELDRIRARKKVLPELIRLAGSLERLPNETKAELANLFIEAASDLAREKNHCAPHLDALGHILSRAPLYAGPETVVSPDLVERAFESFRRFDWGAPELAEMPSVFLRAGRVVGDRRFDLPKGLRHQIAAKLENLGIAPQKTGKLKEFIPVGRSERISLHEESLPPGLILVDS